MSILNIFRKDNAKKTNAANPVAENPQPMANPAPKPEAAPDPQPQAATDTKSGKETGKETGKESDKEPVKNRRVHNLLILDESGSMRSIYRPALTGVNETLQTIRSAQTENPGQNHYVTLVAFDSERYNQIYKNTSAEMARDITPEQYRPGGCTPLYDAMGRAISELRTVVEEGDVVLVTIITDGYENASKEYNSRTIRQLVEKMRGEGWVFTYIGANQDVEYVGKTLSINNCLEFDADEDGTNEMFAKEMAARKKFYSKVHLNSCCRCEDLDNDYFA